MKKRLLLAGAVGFIIAESQVLVYIAEGVKSGAEWLYKHLSHDQA